MKEFILRLMERVLSWEARIYRGRYSGPVIAITGSVGKTNTKEALAILVTKAYGPHCLITPKSFNHFLGISLTLLGFEKEPRGVEWLIVPFRGLLVAFFGTLPKCMVLEVGAENPGDIAKLSHLIRPTHAIITLASEAHSIYLGDLANIQREKASLLNFLAPDGVVILNGDDQFLAKLPVQPGQHKVIVRMNERADYFISSVRVSLEGTEGILHYGNRTQRVRIQRFGAHHMYSVMFVAAIAESLGISREVMVESIKELKPVPGRGMLLAGKQKSYILDESYNAQPAAMRAAIELIGELPVTKRILVLGDMRELKDPEPVHQEIGKLARKHADYIIGVGPQSKAYRPDEWFLTAEEAIPAALRQMQPGAIVLVKGGQNTIRLERFVKGIMMHPSQAKHVLVRQEPEWQRIP